MSGWIVAHQSPLSMGFYRQEYWGGFPFPPPEDLPNPETELTSSVLAGRLFTTESPGKLLMKLNISQIRSSQRRLHLDIKKNAEVKYTEFSKQQEKQLTYKGTPIRLKRIFQQKLNRLGKSGMLYSK